MRLLLLVLCLIACVHLVEVGAACPKTQCGNLTVDYPFGVEDGCGNPNYTLTCTGSTLQINNSVVQSIDYDTRSVTLSSGAGCPFGSGLPPFEIRLCNSAQDVCISDSQNCCLRRNGNDIGCNVYTPLDRVASTAATVSVSELKFVWSDAESKTCKDCTMSKGQCGYNTTNNAFSCICGNTNSSTVCEEEIRSTNKPIWLSGSLAIAVIVVVLVFGVSLSIYWKWKKNEREENRQEPIFSLEDSKQEVDNLREILSTRRGEPAKMFTVAEIDKATNGFENDRKVGIGGFGTVYKGELGGSVVAIKRANHTSKQSSKHFVNEVSVLSQVNHRNLVRLIGCCIDTDVPILVYEYVPNGTLFDHLHKRAEVLSWNNRLRIAIETAEALAYLHSAAYPPIYHRDVKSANILLENNFTAKVADFGLSRLVPIDVTHVSTMVQGTPGYVDPEYHQTYQLTEKSDVYSFGVVLLELVTGRKPVDFSRASRDVNLTAYSVPLIRKGQFDDIVDSRLEAHGDLEVLKSMKSVADIAVACLAFFREERPTMKQVLEELLAVRGSSGLGHGDHHWLEGEVILAESYHPSEGVSYNSATAASNSREQHSAELTPR